MASNGRAGSIPASSTLEAAIWLPSFFLFVRCGQIAGAIFLSLQFVACQSTTLPHQTTMPPFGLAHTLSIHSRRNAHLKCGCADFRDIYCSTFRSALQDVRASLRPEVAALRFRLRVPSEEISSLF